MTSSKQWMRLLIKGFLRIAFRMYYRSIQVQGAEVIPKEGAVLLVANHPNSLLDPAILVHLFARPLHFGAKHTLFSGPYKPILEAFGAIPLVRAQDDPRGGRRNLEALDRYAELLNQKLATAIFPEGVSQDDPQVVPIKTGAARIALKAESAADFNLGLLIVPVGLQFEPRRRFRADAFVRFGEPLKIADLAKLHAENPRQAIRELTGEIDTALKKLAFHVAEQENLPLVERLADVYFQRVQQTGLAGVDRKGLRGELLYRTAACLNHYLQADPDAVTEIEHQLELYERLREKAGVDRQILEEGARLLPGPLAPAQVVAEVLLGAIPALFGFVTGAIPFYLTRGVSNKILSGTKHAPALSFIHIVVGLVAFLLFYGLEIWWVSSYVSNAATLAFILLLIPTGLFTRFYSGRVWKLCSHLGGRVSSWAKLSAVTRVTQAQNDLLQLMDRMRERYRVEVLGWSALPPRRPFPLRTAFAVLLAAVLVILGFLVAQLG
jgi:1-acyl-sn-glycerol-3-phosphate acyltransferase